MKYLPYLFAGLILASSASAAPELKIAPVYEVEILVFKNMQIEDQGNELWLQDISPDNSPEVTDAMLAGGGVPANSEIRKISDKLIASDKYIVISHKRWLQDAIPKTEARLMRIANSEENFDGTLLFYKNRFLHLNMDLVLKENLVPAGESDTLGNTANFFTIKEHRRIRSTSINYFDHPRFGVLVQVNLVKTSTK